jgi:isopenicillin N synthase-like dioxygenase
MEEDMKETRLESSEFELAERVHPVTIDYTDLVNPEYSLEIINRIEEGLGKDGLGIIGIRNVPGFVEKRQRLLPLAARLCLMPEHIQTSWEDPESSFNVGWSFGKESLKNGLKDSRKGSYYANPMCDSVTEDAALLKEYPSYTRPNIWPSEHVPDLEESFKELGALIYRIGMRILEVCGGGDCASDAQCAKGRLLCYLPQKWHDHKAQIDEGQEDAGMWCAWHKDHGSLTGLCPAYFLSSPDTQDEIECPDPSSGLYVRTRKGALVKIVMNKDVLGFQVGEALEALTGGRVAATPHCVRAAKSPETTRCTFALFMQPHWNTPLSSLNREDSTESHDKEQHPEIDHWTPGMTFGDFSKAKFAAYYHA